MSYDFYVLDGKKLIDYKPKLEHYAKALCRHITSTESNHDDSVESRNKTLYLLIKMIGKERVDKRKYDTEYIHEMFEMMEFVNSLIAEKTPRQFMQLFPVEKEYDGDKYGVKDYFYCLDYMRKIGMDELIGDKTSEFLMEYWNWDINYYVVQMMGIISAMHIMHTGKDPLIEFFEEQGLHFTIYHREGDEMVNDETGERYEIVKPENRMKKLFSVDSGSGWRNAF